MIAYVFDAEIEAAHLPEIKILFEIYDDVKLGLRLRSQLKLKLRLRLGL